ncbi:DEKNAAC100580 [Brettanomyces naardenensis]|uniref:Cytochrome c oxidase-assembly factor COX23, mitochondrial n=1 Tax=Brettanomyces naardenensis TaxID=13370 RepID=A0A448YF10_BRENA|nr:DEKNAAC100580 [Brettanomyces naardenensis]
MSSEKKQNESEGSKKTKIASVSKLELKTEDETDFVKDVDGKKVLRFYPDKPEDHAHQKMFLVKAPTQFYDPCAKSSKMAIRCMEQHDQDYKEWCGEYFRAYRECKKEWLKKRKEGTW